MHAHVYWKMHETNMHAYMHDKSTYACVHAWTRAPMHASEVGGSETGLSVTPYREIVFRVRAAIATRSCVSA